MIRLTDKSVCMCKGPSIVEDFEGWKRWTVEHWKVCQPRRIIDLPLPGDEVGND